MIFWKNNDIILIDMEKYLCKPIINKISSVN